MAHYDCSNCGERMGIAFGSCSSCTPKEFHTVSEQIQKTQAADKLKADKQFEK